MGLAHETIEVWDTYQFGDLAGSRSAHGLAHVRNCTSGVKNVSASGVLAPETFTGPQTRKCSHQLPKQT